MANTPQRRRGADHSEREQRLHLARQIADDTCTAHGVFCCEQCFNMDTAFTVEVNSDEED